MCTAGMHPTGLSSKTSSTQLDLRITTWFWCLYRTKVSSTRWKECRPENVLPDEESFQLASYLSIRICPRTSIEPSVATPWLSKIERTVDDDAGGSDTPSHYLCPRWRKCHEQTVKIHCARLLQEATLDTIIKHHRII